MQFGHDMNPSLAPQDPAPLPQAAPVVVDWNGDGVPDVFDLDEQGQLLLRLGQPGSPGEYDSPRIIGQYLGVSLLATSPWSTPAMDRSWPRSSKGNP